MAFGFPGIRPKSNGVPVTGVAYRHIRRGDAARGRGEWRAAAAAYRAALGAMPSLGHIWVQLGHAEKEGGDAAAATAAYTRAAALLPADPEPYLFLGHMAKRAGDGRAARHYLDALRRAPLNLSATWEVTQELLTARHTDTAVIDEALDLLSIDRADLDSIKEPAAVAGAVFLDVTDLLAYFGFSRIPSGIQRVQIEIVLALLTGPRAESIRLCHYSVGRQGWSPVSRIRFAELCAADPMRVDEDWAARLRLLYIASALDDAIAFPADTVLISFSANAPSPNYLLDIRTSTARNGVVYISLIYDLIPILRPEWFVADQTAAFRASMRSLLHSAQGFVAISEATRSDLLVHAAAAVTPDAVRVLVLDGDPIKADRLPLPSRTLAKWGLSQGRYVLFVSTIEPRKNHVGAFAAWERLAAELGWARMPELVCVGGKGWLNDAVHTMLAERPRLRRKVKLLSGIGDDELDLLYRECAFTIYPSFYEGWGLPVTESLGYGKVPAISNAASLPEAGGSLAVYYDPRDEVGMAAAIRALIVDPAARADRERAIAAGFAPRPWLAIGDQLLHDARDIADAVRREGARDLVAPPGVAMSLAAADRIAPDAGNGEIFRLGRGWGPPDAEGCVAAGRDSLLRLAVPEGGALLTVALRGGEAAAGYALAGGTEAAVGGIAAGERAVIAVPLAPGTRTVAIDATAPLLVEWLRLDDADDPAGLADPRDPH